MNIYTVRDNLKNTIAGKEDLLAIFSKPENSAHLTDIEKYGREAVNAFLKVNIDELKRILADVEKCSEKATYDSWKENPDRMGGQFTQDEIDNANRWN